MRFLRTVISLGFALFGAAVVVVALGAYLTASGRSGPVMRLAAAKAGDLTSGQSTLQLNLSVSVDPLERRLAGVARLRVRADEARERIYLLLNDGLAVRQVWLEAPGAERRELRHYRFWVVAVVDLDQALAAGEEATIAIAYDGQPLAGLLPLGQRVLESDEVIFTPSTLWYPSDLRSFAPADVEVTLPASLEVVHSGAEGVVTDLGHSRRTRFSTERVVSGLSLVAGRYQRHSSEAGETAFRTYLGEGVALDPVAIAESIADAFATTGASAGPSGAARQALFVSRRLQRPFADGSGLIGLTPAEFNGGDYGYAAIGEGVARSWWGGLVGSDPTRPQDGGGWVIDGFAANAARAAVRGRYGADAERRWRAARAFDPTAAGALSEHAPVDGELSGRGSDVLRNKAAYVAMMLQESLGEPSYAGVVAAMIERCRGRAATTKDLREIVAEVGGGDLDDFIDEWVSSVGAADLSLDPTEGGAVIANHQPLSVGSSVELWRVPPGGQPIAQSFAVGDTTPIGNAERIVVDPRGLLADMYRSNNVLPREDGPRAIARSQRGSWMIVEGEPHPWAPARIREVDATGKTLHVWDFDRGILGDPAWSADGSRVLAAEPGRGGAATLYSLHSADGSMAAIGEDIDVGGDASGYIAARGRQLVRIGGKSARSMIAVDAGSVALPRVSPDGAHVAYVVKRGGHVELRARGDGGDRLLMTWPGASPRWSWSPDSTRLFAVVPGDWDWQLWEIPLDDPPRPLMREAAGVRGMAVSPDGARIALAAQPALDYRFEKFEVFLIDRTGGEAPRRYTVGGQSVVDLAWRDDESLVVIVTDPTHATVPERRVVSTLQLSDGSVLPFP